jgi:hypothetical protein
MEWLLSPFLYLFIAKDKGNLEIGMENRQRDVFFAILILTFTREFELLSFLP